MILASSAVTGVIARPRSWGSAAWASACAAGALVVGAGAFRPAITATAPTFAFLAVAVGVAAAAVRLGAAIRLASLLARAADGCPLRLYALVCTAAAVATALVSLDGAVVLLVPVVVELARRNGVALRPLLLGVTAVANTFSLALPEGNPTNLVVLARLGMGFVAYTELALPAGTAAALVCAIGVGWLERGRLAGPASNAVAPSHFVDSLGAVARLAVQLSALLVVLIPLSWRVPALSVGGLGGAFVVAAGAAAASAFANNLPASAAIASGLAGPSAYAALAGISVGALATAHGSVATLLASELAGESAYERRLVPVVAVALAVATVLLSLRA